MSHTVPNKYKSWRDRIPLPIHPAADLFPMQLDAELIVVGEDIKKHNLTQLITIFRDTAGKDWLLDGRNRLAAMERVGIQFSLTFSKNFGWGICIEQEGIPPGAIGTGVVVVQDIDPYAYVISVNLKRRHLTSEGKRHVIAGLLRQMPDRSNNYIAKLLGVDDKTVASVRIDLPRSEIPNVETLTDTKGRQQPAHKPKRASKPPQPQPDQNKPDAAAATIAEQQQLDRVCRRADFGAATETAQDDPVSDPLPPAGLSEAIWEETRAAARALRRLNQAIGAPQVVENLTRRMIATDPALGGAADDVAAALARATAGMRITRASGSWSPSDSAAPQPDLHVGIIQLIDMSKRAIHWINDLPEDVIYSKADLDMLITRIETLNRHMAKRRGKKVGAVS